MSPRCFSRISVFASLLFLAAAARADETSATPKKLGLGDSAPNPNQVSGRPTYGTDDLIYIRFNGLDFYPYSGVPLYVSSGKARYTTTPSALEATLRIPSGAVLEYLELNACDTNVANPVSLELFECDPIGFVCANFSGVTSVGSGGCQTVSVSGIGHTVDNANFSLVLEADIEVGDGSLQIAGAAVGYRLQVSPSPAAATFGDVLPGTLYYQFIEALAASGITAGCDAVPNYCPDRAITRAEMAVFLAKALGLHFPN